MEKQGGGEKKAWQKPELIVLVRSKPEESVLVTCKYGGVGPLGLVCADTFCNDIVES